jgi:hypothetical protein
VPPVLDEKALRKPEFDDGISIVLTDGQEWVFPRPVVRTRFSAHNDVGFQLVARVKGDPSYGALYESWINAETGLDSIKAEHALARALILNNYDLTDDQVSDLIQFSHKDDDDADPEGYRIREHILAVVRGDTPKR